MSPAIRLKLPVCLYLEVTNRCNLRCRACIRQKGGWEKERDVAVSEFRLISGQLPSLERAVLHGIGEPLLNKDLPAFIRHLKDRGVYVLFNTNATLLDAAVQERLIRSGLDELRVSIDSSTPKGYAAVRGSGKFALVVGNVSAFAERLRSKGLISPRISLWFLATGKSISELPGLIRLARSAGIPAVHLQRLVYFTDGKGYGIARAMNSLFGPAPRMASIISESQELASKLDITLSASGISGDALGSLRPKGKSPWKRCARPREVIYITANGNVLPCCITPFSTTDYGSIIMGNVFESSIAGIWHGRKYTEFRKKLGSDSPPRCCRGCGIKWSL